ncbi:MAG: Tol-Pal system beta propeller repeat protein TolB [Thermodesulfobacteriota bacterium]|nr:Tol-Pal system beta propeller repeat protein TolB [Thermodesulfobacteriota bacterium]
MKSKSTSISAIWRAIRFSEVSVLLFSMPNIPRGRIGGFSLLCILGAFSCITCLLVPGQSFGRIYIDINSPSVRKFKIAIPDFKNLNSVNKHPELSSSLPEVAASDLDFSGFFSPIDKEAFLGEEDGSLNKEDIQFKGWSVIGAELLLKGTYTYIGRSLEVEIRVFDVFWGRQILGKRALGDIHRFRHLMHRLSNDVIRTLTGHDGIFLTKLAFVGNSSGHKEIYFCDYDGHNVQQITADKSIALLPRWSPGGKKILYNSYKDGGPMLYMQDFASGSVRRISARSGLNTGASWSPDGSEVALTLSPGGDPDIFTIDLDGKVKRQLTDNWGIDVSPAFSPDGKRIAYVSNRSGTPQIYMLDLIDGMDKRLTFEDESFKGRYCTSPAWSSLNQIAFSSLNQGHFEIYTMDANGGHLRQLTENQGDNEDPCWSPDGRYIVFSSNRQGRYHLYIMNANGQNQRRVTFLEGDHTAPSWAP